MTRHAKRDLILYGELVGSGAHDPELLVEGSEPIEGDGRVNILGVGPGLAYHLDNNSYISGTFAITQLSAQNEDGKEVGDTEWGLGASVSFGREWWVSENWGLGAALRLHAASFMQDRAEVLGETPTWKAFGINLFFSATFN